MTSGYRHEALLYAGDEQFVERLTPFLLEGAAAGEPTLVVVAELKIDLLKKALGPDASRITFADMADVGANPAHIIPAWQDFIDGRSGGSAIRGVGEPITADRESHDLVERQNHEALLNLAFPDETDFWLLCPYDTVALPWAVVAEAYCNHPLISDGESHEQSNRYLSEQLEARTLASALPEPTDVWLEAEFGFATLPLLRAQILDATARVGMSCERREDLLVAAGEVLDNSVRHGGGSGTLRLWLDGSNLVCEVRDAGMLRDPLAGRRRPAGSDAPGGLWRANQLCDLVQLRRLANGTVVRLHQRLS